MLPIKAKKKGVAWWFPASLAAALFLFIAWLWLLNKPVTQNEQLVRTKQETPKTGAFDKGLSTKENTFPLDIKVAPLHKRRDSFLALIPKTSGPNSIHSDDEISKIHDDLGKYQSSQNNAKSFAASERSEIPIYNHPFKGSILHPNDSLFLRSAQINHLNVIVRVPPKPIKKKSIDLKEDGVSRLSLGLAVAPDINSVSNFKTSKVGHSFGLSANYQLSSKISISSGITYSTKLYAAQPNQYKATWANSNAAAYAESIEADCRVLDVPINLNYEVLRSPKRTLFVSAGVSSYFMLNEKYTLITAKSQSGYPAYSNHSYEYSKRNEHLLNVLNLSAGIATPLNKQTKLIIEPYARLPLTGVGEGKVDLKSIGVNFQLQYNFRKKGKLTPTSVNVVQQIEKEEN